MTKRLIKAIIVEDDLMVASINKQYVTTIPCITVAATVHNGKEAWDYLNNHRADLIILDEYMPGLTGLELLSKIRAAKMPSDVIMVTAANDTKSLETAIRLGVIDYLVKPFNARRFREAVDKYLTKRQMFLETGEFTQLVIDKMIGQDSWNKKVELSKGLQDKTLKKIQELLSNHDDFLTCEDIACIVGFSRVTVKRYMNYLIELNEVVSEVDYQTGGRPSIRYRCVKW